jgi:hypothetical protein
MSQFVLAWSSGHQPPRTMYFMALDSGHWNATEKRDEATTFRNADEAIKTYKKRCTAWPDHEPYVSAIRSGAVRAEPVIQPSLCL